MFTTQQAYEAVLEQLALENNCSSADFGRSDNLLTLPTLHEKRRPFAAEPFFFKMVTLGGNAVLSADPCLHGWLEAFIQDKAGHGLFEYPNLREIDRELAKYGRQLGQSHHMHLPRYDVEAPAPGYPVRWFEQEDISRFYENTKFPNALSATYNPDRPDMLAVAAYEQNQVIGMAACSADTPLLWQIGIDVLPGHRGKRLGTTLVLMLKNEIMRRGKIPYYGTSLSNLHSWNIALNCGFRPVWVEVVAHS